MSISTVTSEALQLKLRQLLPSQQGFGTDLSASDTIIPVIDLTTAAEGSDVGETLQTALAFGSQTVITAANSSVTIANTPGFYKITGQSTVRNDDGNTLQFTLSDGSTTKVFQQIQGYGISTATKSVYSQFHSFVVFLTSGDSVNVVCTGTNCRFDGSVRQIADSNGTLVNPVGFTPQ